MKNIRVSMIKAKRDFAELLGRVAEGRESFTITQRGNPLAVLAPTTPTEGLQSLTGWLNNGDPFFKEIEQIVSARKKHKARHARLSKI